MAPTICVCTSGLTPRDYVDLIKKALPGTESPVIHGDDPHAFAAAKAENDGLILFVFGPAAHAVIKDLCDDYGKEQRRVKFIYSISAGVDAYRLSELKEELAGIPFCNAQGCYSNALAEHVAFSMMYFNRFPWRLIAFKNERKWGEFNNVVLRGQKAVVIGYGDIGQACGQKAAALGMHVTGIRRSGDNTTDKFGVMVRGNDALDECVREADFVIGVLPGTEQTKHFFNKAFFANMKPSAVFINIGRGASQCEVDLIDALDKNIIRGAALDVFEVEPLPKESPMWDVPDSKLLLSAHMADMTEDISEIPVTQFAEIFEEFSKHGTISAYTVCTTKGY
ncbi:d-isomer specific 2-hydroxyacid dehydrogenase- protein [Novymonas esmeraldas]|uniref:D-isomer specific 2-hydroxyacid dehydrogenase-protein n=1 Tax=Novymonas esmeraldas TaxID=1808958 RepID=A0AAW0F1Q6_9TRYP